MLIWSVVWLILDRMHEYTNWLNSISSYLFITYVLGIFLIYIIGTIANEVKLFYQIKNLEQRYDGLLNQHRIDMNDKQRLKSQIELKDFFIRILSIKLPEDKLLEVKQQFDLLKEMAEIEQKNEGSKNN